MAIDRWTTYDVVFDEVMQILVSLIEDDKERIRWKVVEQIYQRQTRNTNSVFEHIDVLLLIEGSTVCRELQGREQRRGYCTKLKSRASSSLGCCTTLPGRGRNLRRVYPCSSVGYKTLLGEEVVNILEWEVSFFHRTSFRFQILVVAKTGSKIVYDINKSKLDPRKTHEQ